MSEKSRILIVGDDRRMARTLVDILRARGFAVSELSDPHGVVEVLSSDGQVVLLDMKLNSIGGLDVLKETRKRHPRLEKQQFVPEDRIHATPMLARPLPLPLRKMVADFSQGLRR